MKCRILFVTYMCIIFTSSAQLVRIDTIKATNPYFKKSHYIFPKIKIANHKVIADSINKDLISDFLQIEPNEVKKSIFENIWATSANTTPSLADISFEIHRIDRFIFSISISAEGCGAYCEYFTANYNYDLRTGKRIKMASLFTQAGLQFISDSVLSFKKLTLKNKINETKDTLKINMDSTEKNYYRDMLDLYETCLEKTDEFTVEDIPCYINKNEIIFILDRCSVHYNRNLDELGDFIIPFQIKRLKFLSNYGKKLLEDE